MHSDGKVDSTVNLKTDSAPSVQPPIPPPQ
jgi:hypothetical protein